jgi:ribonuclease HI
MANAGAKWETNMYDAKQVTIYTDGACTGNPGPGGYGVVLLHDATREELSGGFRRTTNNRMEILAAIVGLEALKEPCRVDLYSDSEYLVNAIELGWAKRWRAKSWRRSTGEPALNPDLWERLLNHCDRHEVKFHWVRGHAGNPENERADRLAVQAASQPGLPPDEVYEATQAANGSRPRTASPSGARPRRFNGRARRA